MLPSHFISVRDYKIWENTTRQQDLPQQDLPQQDLSDHQRHATIVLPYVSTLPKNVSGPIKLTKDPRRTFEFTVMQRKFASQAKTVGSLSELEAKVSLWFLKFILKLSKLVI